MFKIGDKIIYSGVSKSDLTPGTVIALLPNGVKDGEYKPVDIVIEFASGVRYTQDSTNFKLYKEPIPFQVGDFVKPANPRYVEAATFKVVEILNNPVINWENAPSDMVVEALSDNTLYHAKKGQTMLVSSKDYVVTTEHPKGYLIYDRENRKLRLADTLYDGEEHITYDFN